MVASLPTENGSKTVETSAVAATDSTGSPSDKAQSAPRPASAFGSALARAPVTAGSALRKTADGTVQGPRVVVRRKKAIEPETDDDEGEEDEEDSEDDEDDEDGESDDGDNEDSDDSEEGEDVSEDEESDDEGGDEDEEAFEGTASGKQRASGFKAWALAQMGQTVEHSAPDLLESHAATADPTASSTSVQESKPRIKPTGPAIGPMGSTFSVPEENLLAQSQSKVKAGTSGSSASLSA